MHATHSLAYSENGSYVVPRQQGVNVKVETIIGYRSGKQR